MDFGFSELSRNFVVAVAGILNLSLEKVLDEHTVIVSEHDEAHLSFRDNAEAPYAGRAEEWGDIQRSFGQL